MKIKLRRTDGADNILDSIQGDDSVQSLREKVSQLIGVELERIRLIFSGRVLQDTEKLDSYGITDDCTIHVVVRQDHATSSNPASAPTPAPAPNASSSGRVGTPTFHNLGNGVTMSTITLDRGAPNPLGNNPFGSLLSSLGVPVQSVQTQPRILRRSPDALTRSSSSSASSSAAGMPTAAAGAGAGAGVHNAHQSSTPSTPALQQFNGVIESCFSTTRDIAQQSRSSSGSALLTDIGSLDFGDSRAAMGFLLRDVNAVFQMLASPIGNLSEDILESSYENATRPVDRINIISERRNVVAMLKLISEATAQCAQAIELFPSLNAGPTTAHAHGAALGNAQRQQQLPGGTIIDMGVVNLDINLNDLFGNMPSMAAPAAVPAQPTAPASAPAAASAPSSGAPSRSTSLESTSQLAASASSDSSPLVRATSSSASHLESSTTASSTVDSSLAITTSASEGKDDSGVANEPMPSTDSSGQHRTGPVTSESQPPQSQPAQSQPGHSQQTPPSPAQSTSGNQSQQAGPTAGPPNLPFMNNLMQSLLSGAAQGSNGPAQVQIFSGQTGPGGALPDNIAGQMLQSLFPMPMPMPMPVPITPVPSSQSGGDSPSTNAAGPRIVFNIPAAGSGGAAIRLPVPPGAVAGGVGQPTFSIVQTAGLPMPIPKPWHTPEDAQHRRQITSHIANIVRELDPRMQGPEIQAHAVQIEASLYHNAATFEEYINASSLQQRVTTLWEQRLHRLAQQHTPAPTEST